MSYIGDTSQTLVCAKWTPTESITTVSGPGIQGTDYWNAVGHRSPGKSLRTSPSRTQNKYNTYSVIDRVNPDGTLTRGSR